MHNMKSVWLLTAAIGIIGSNSLVLSPIAGDVAESFVQQSAIDVMTASAIYGAGTAISALLFAPYADRIGLRRVLLLALLTLSISLCISASAPWLIVLVASQGLAGLSAGLGLPAIYGIAADIAPEGRESETLGKVLTGWTLSLVAGVALSATLADFVHWRAVFILLGGLGLLLVVLLFKADMPIRAKPVQITSPLTALRIKGVLPILFGVVCYMSAFYGLYAYLGVHLTKTLLLTTTVAGIASLCYGIGFGLVAPLDRFIDRYGATRAAPAIFSVLLAAYVGLGLVSEFWILVFIACVFWGAANHLGLNILVGQLTALSPNQRGTILGLYSAVTYASMFIGTALFKPVFQATGFSSIAFLSAACIVPALLYACWRSRRDLSNS